LATPQISGIDLEHLRMIRANVRLTIQAAAERHDRSGVRVLDIAPQDYLGGKEFFRNARLETFDIDPKSGADIVGDICRRNEQVADQTYDVVLCTEVLEHTLDPFAAAREILRILKKGGTLFATTPFNFRIHGPLPDCWRFTIHGLKQLFRDYSRVEIREFDSMDARFLMPLQYQIEAVR
jgi:SAM-dependent methyltransferase